MIAISSNGHKIPQMVLRMEVGQVISIDCEEVKDHPSST